MKPYTIAAFSGGKDSTAMVLAMFERGEPIDELMITPTGDELPEIIGHWDRVSGMIGLPLTVPDGPSLSDVIESQKALPNFRMRFCTRMIKIVPAKAHVMRRQSQGYDVTMCVGLRADEEERKGIIDEKVNTRFPLREYGMGIDEVWQTIRRHEIRIPERTDCARCYHQRIGEWYRLWLNHPDVFEDAASQEERMGATFRSPGRDTWPVALRDLGNEFEGGRIPKSELNRRQLPLFEDEGANGVCRVCRL